MLRQVRPNSKWLWFATGKHPAAGDYFRVGGDFPMAKSLAKWMTAGYSSVSSQGFSVSALKAWRFWASGPSRGQICGGILRDSSDKFGRPYPLLMAGTGPLQGWEEAWDLVPMVLEKSWQKMERLATRSFGQLQEVEDELLGFSPPSPEWARCRAERDEIILNKTAMSGGGQTALEELKSRHVPPARETELIIPVNETLHLDPTAVLSHWQMVLKGDKDGTTPNAVFLGGLQEKSFLVFFRRALVPGDFHKLWSLKP
jgi:type VI secretion system protein VasJ